MKMNIRLSLVWSQQILIFKWTLKKADKQDCLE